MSKKIRVSVMGLMAAFILSAGLMAQEKTEVSIQVKKDGKVVKDTTYTYDDPAEAKHVWKMVEVMSGMDADMEKGHYNYTMAHSDGKHANTMVFISEDGEKTKIKEMHGDSLVWISEGDEGEGKRVKVIVSGDEKGTWTAVSADDADLDENKNVFHISEDDDVKVEVREILEETGDGENVKVIVIKKNKVEMK